MGRNLKGVADLWLLRLGIDMSSLLDQSSKVVLSKCGLGISIKAHCLNLKEI